jgi:hypothetical protein
VPPDQEANLAHAGQDLFAQGASLCGRDIHGQFQAEVEIAQSLHVGPQRLGRLPLQ